MAAFATETRQQPRLPRSRWARRLLAGFSGCLIAWPYVVVSLTEGALRIPAPLRNQPSPAIAERAAEEQGARWQAVEIRAADGAPLRGWLFVPRTPNGGAVILLHGVGDTRQGAAGHVRYLLPRGYYALAPDNRGHGASGGDLVTYGVRERDDVHRWADWLFATQPVSRLYGMGHSLGAAILLQAAGCEPRFRAVVAESPFSGFRQIAYDRLGVYTGVARPWRFVFALLVEPSLWYARWRYGVDLTEAAPAEAVRQTRVPILLIHGTADRHIEIHHSRELRAANPAALTLWEVPGGTHIRLLKDGQEEYVRRVTGWFDTHK